MLFRSAPVLLDERFVEVIFRFDVALDHLRHIALGGEGAAGSDSDDEEAQGDDDQKGWDDPQKPVDDIFGHSVPLRSIRQHGYDGWYAGTLTAFSILYQDWTLCKNFENYAEDIQAVETQRVSSQIHRSSLSKEEGVVGRWSAFMVSCHSSRE